MCLHYALFLAVPQLKPQYRFTLFTTHAPTGDVDVYARPEHVNDFNETHYGVSGEGGETYHRPVRELSEHGQLRLVNTPLL